MGLSTSGSFGRGVDHIVSADDYRGVGVIELRVYVFEVVELLVGDADLGQENVHVTWHTTGHGVDAEEDLLALGLQRLHQVSHGLLGLGDGESVTGYDHDFLRLVREVLAHLPGALVVDFPVFLLLASATPGSGDAGEDDLAQGAPQRARHQSGENRTRGPDQRTADNECVIGEHEARGRRREPGERVEQRDHDGHVGPADGDYEQDAEQQRSAQDQVQRDERREHEPARQDVRGEQQDTKEDGGVHHLLQRERNRARQRQLLELDERDGAPREAHRPYNDAEEHSDGGDERLVALAEGLHPVELRDGDERGRAAAHAVERSDHLRHRRHLYPLGRDRPDTDPISTPTEI